MKKMTTKIFVCIFMLLVNITALRADNPTSYNYQGLRYAIVNVPAYFGNDKPWLMRIKTAEEWTTLNLKMWDAYAKALHRTDPLPLSEIPSYDFEHYDLVMGGVGFGVSSCYDLMVIWAGPGYIGARGIPYTCAPGDTVSPGFAFFKTTVGVLLPKLNPKVDYPITVSFKTLSPDSLKVTSESDGTLN